MIFCWGWGRSSPLSVSWAWSGCRTCSRLQASTCIGSLGNIFLALGGIVYAIGTNPTEAGTYVKLIVIMLMVLLTNPVSNHSMCRAACNSGVLPSSKMVINDYKEDDPE